MGCANIKKTYVKTKDVDLLSGELIKPLQKDVNNILNASPKKASSEIFNNEKFNYKNLEKSKNTKKNNKTKQIVSKPKSLNNLNEIHFSGPIISLLKNKVDIYKKNVLNNKAIIVNKQTNFN